MISYVAAIIRKERLDSPNVSNSSAIEVFISSSEKAGMLKKSWVPSYKRMAFEVHNCSS